MVLPRPGHPSVPATRRHRTDARARPHRNPQGPAAPADGAPPADEGRDGGLYDAILDAYRQLSRGYRPGMLNEVLVLTGGASGGHDRVTLDRLVAELRKDFDPERQVNITLMAFGDGVDMRPLKEIAQATEGAAYQIHNEGQIMTLFRCAIALRVNDDLHCSR